MKKPTAKPIADATAYAQSVVAGEVLACKWTILACKRHIADLERSAKNDPAFPFYFDEVEAARRVEFCALLRHYKGEKRGQPFILEPWQRFIFGSVFGWKHRETKMRRFRYALVIVPRKAGKTFCAAAVAIQLLIAGGNLTANGAFTHEPGAEVYFVATSEAQARIGWKDCVKIIKRSPGFSDLIASRVSEIRFEDADAVCRPLGSDSDTLDGLNPSGAVKDELHAWKDRELWDVVEDAFGARTQPLAFVISTEGSVRGGIFDEQMTHAKNVLEGKDAYTDEAYFTVIYAADEDDDPFDERTWAKANPNLGVSKSLEYMRDQAAKAKLMPGKRGTFMAKQLNIRVNEAARWIDLGVWDRCAGDLVPSELEKTLIGRPCTVGLDLARTVDMSALSLVFQLDDGKVAALWRYWYPGDLLDESARRDRVPYLQWSKAGLLNATDGNVTDFGVIEEEIAQLAKLFTISRLSYDPMFGTDLALRLQSQHEVPVEPFLQTYTNYTMPCTELERLIVSGRLAHGGHAIARWNAGNVVLREGPSGNRLPDKGKSKARIDGISALLMALGNGSETEAPMSGVLFL